MFVESGFRAQHQWFTILGGRREAMRPALSLATSPQAEVYPTMNRTLITLATYNEIENLPDLVSEILRIAPTVDILVIDDNSPDGTGQWCDAMPIAIRG